jgi:MFS family permease
MNNTENRIKAISTGTFAALQFPNYKLWFFGQMVSLVGTWMQATAQQYLIYTLTGSAAYLGIIAFANGLPSILLTLYGGVIADRIHRRTLLIITQTSMMILAFIMTALVFLKVIQPWHVALLAFLLGVANAFDAPARQSFVHELVDKEYMTNAIALNATMFNIGTVVGPAAAGLTYAAFGPGWCFTINGISFIAVIIGLFLMKIPPMPIVTGQQRVMTEIKESVKYVMDSKLIRGLMINLGFISLFGFSLIALLSAWSVTILKGDSTTYGYLLSARGIGSLMAGLLLASLGNTKNRGKIWGISSLILPVLWVAFAIITNLPLSLIMIGIIGFFLILVNNLTNAMVQTHVLDNLRGRVMGIYTLIFFGLSAIGSLIAGFAAEKIGEQWTVAICGVILMGTAIYSWFKMPYLRKTE